MEPLVQVGAENPAVQHLADHQVFGCRGNRVVGFQLIQDGGVVGRCFLEEGGRRIRCGPGVQHQGLGGSCGPGLPVQAAAVEERADFFHKQVGQGGKTVAAEVGYPAEGVFPPDSMERLMPWKEPRPMARMGLALFRPP